MNQPITSVILIALTALCVYGSFAAWRSLRRRITSPRGIVSVVLGVCLLVSAGLLVGRWLAHGELSRPLHAHVDGLVLIGLLLAGALLFLRWRPRMLLLTAIGMPVLAFVYSWAVCAAVWTYRPFELESLTPLWSKLHLAGVYLGTLFFVIGAVAGVAFLFVHRRLKRKLDPGTVGEWPALETLERLVIRCCTLGFALLSIGLIGGVVVLSLRPNATGSMGWLVIKVVLAASVWLVYGLLINVRFTQSFRGRRAAWLSIAGLFLLLITYGVVTALPHDRSDATTTENIKVPHEFTPSGRAR